MKLSAIFRWLDPVVIASLYLLLNVITDPTFVGLVGFLPLVEIGFVYGPIIAFRFQQRLWSYGSIDDVWDYLKVIGVSGLGIVGITLFFEFRLEYVVFVALTSIYLFVSRFGSRFFERTKTKNKKKILIYGAGDGGNIAFKELSSKYNIVAFIDDDPSLDGLFLHARKVFHSSRIKTVLEDLKPSMVVIAIPSIKRSVSVQIARRLLEFGLKVSMLPALEEIQKGTKQLQIQSIAIEDILGREPVQLNQDELPEYLTNKRVLVTGAGGSIGSELVRQLAQMPLQALVLVDNYENNLYELEQELLRRHPVLKSTLQSIIASVQDEQRVYEVLKSHQPHIIFHAAAHKHVPLMETSPDEAIKNNIQGSYHVMKCADELGIEQVVIVSTDKAVNPTNVMGATKRVVEIVMQSMSQHSKTKFSAVRFGNVLGSHGSVIPLFEKQIAAGGPVTITHPDIKRYFMTIPEACQLILQSTLEANGGEIFVLDMGEPVVIQSLAEQMIRLAGYEPYEEIQIVTTGLRPGEKMFEELLLDEEHVIKTSRDKIFIESPQIVPIDLTKMNNLGYLREYVQTILSKGSLPS
jgi:FlaA1/EpsC-like NDP-sugar epimerase